MSTGMPEMAEDSKCALNVKNPAKTLRRKEAQGLALFSVFVS